MPKYEVTLKEIEIYTIEVEAENPEDACEQAWDILTEDDNKKAIYHTDSDGESEAMDL